MLFLGAFSQGKFANLLLLLLLFLYSTGLQTLISGLFKYFQSFSENVQISFEVLYLPLYFYVQALCLAPYTSLPSSDQKFNVLSPTGIYHRVRSQIYVCTQLPQLLRHFVATHTQIHTPTYMDNKVQVPQESGLHMRCTRQKASQRNVRDGT